MKEHSDITIEDLKEHVKILVEALINLAPSRNRFSQLIFLLPKSIGDMTETYPNLFQGSAVTTLLQLGIQIGEKVDVYSGSSYYEDSSKIIAYRIKSIVEEVLRLFDKEKVREFLSKWLEMDIPNLNQEWFELKLQIVISEPNLGSDAKKVLKAMYENSKDSYSWRIKIEELENITGLRKDRVYLIRDILEDFGIVKRSYEDSIELSEVAEKFKESIEKIVK